MGLIFTDDEIGEMVQEADIDGDQHISFDEFRELEELGVCSVPEGLSATSWNQR